MNYDYIDRISELVSLNTFRKAVSQLEGDYLSSYRNRSREFDDLAQYVYGDNVRDIDWKSSARTGDLLVRRYKAQRRHLALFVCDTGTKMTGHTGSGELKDSLAVTLLGVTARLFTEIGVDYAMVCAKDNRIYRSLFNGSLQSMLNITENYRSCVDEGDMPIGDILEYSAVNFRKEMIVFMITDLEGLSRLSEKSVRNIMYNKELMVVCIEDAMLTSGGSYDISGGDYTDTYMVTNDVLKYKEQEIKDRIYSGAEALLRHNGANLVRMSGEQDIIEGIVSLMRQVSYRA